MRRILPLGLLALLVLFALPGVGAVAQTPPEATTTTVPASPEAGGTSPWVLVPIGAAAGAVVGALTGLARRRRAERRSHP